MRLNKRLYLAYHPCLQESRRGGTFRRFPVGPSWRQPAVGEAMSFTEKVIDYNLFDEWFVDLASGQARQGSRGFGALPLQNL